MGDDGRWDMRVKIQHTGCQRMFGKGKKDGKEGSKETKKENKQMAMAKVGGG